ncbi:MAG TPA: hypothetical protein VGJ91_11940 [Polyangiaceae bacterium]|jgi:hypothetical protein
MLDTPQPAPAPLPPPPAGPAAAPAAPPAPPPEQQTVWSKFKVQVYGFTELDMISDSTQSFNDLAGNAVIARPDSQAGKRGRMMFGVRNSRFGLRIKGPETEDIKTSGNIEVDLFGNQPGTPPSGAVSEAGFFQSPALRVRHAFLKLETPIVDIVAGQTWALFGWQTYSHPNTVEIQGVPGEVYGRSPQFRIGHTFKSKPVNVEIAVAALRPPQRDSATPDGQAGLRLLINDWKGYRIGGATGNSVDPLGIGVSGTFRHFRVNEFAAAPAAVHKKDGWGVSVDALIPVIPATKENHDNALTLTGSFVTGAGINDQYTGLTGGIGFPALPPPAAGGTAPTYTANIDSGLVTYDAAGELHAIKWQSFIIGAQYYLPFGGLSISGNVSHMHSSNIKDYVASTANVFNDSTWYDGNLFWDVNGAARFGLEYARFNQKYVDGTKAHNDRVQLSAFYVF